MAGKEKEPSLKVSSTAKVVENKEAEQKLRDLQASARKAQKKADDAAQKKEAERAEKQEAARKAAAEEEARRKKEQKEAEAARKKAEKEREEKAEAVEKAAIAAGSALLAGAMKEPDKAKRRRDLLLLAAAAVVLAVAFLIFRQPLLGMLGLGAQAPEALPAPEPGGLTALLPDEEMGYSRIDFTNAILGQAREEQQLIVMEQEVQVDTRLTNALANISLFEKTKTVHSCGTGQYTVDMSRIDEGSIAVDMEERTVSVIVPHTELHAIVVDPEKTAFEQTEHAIFGFGDIKLTQEQQQILDASIQDAMRDELDTPELYAKADEIGCLQVAELFQPLVSAVAEDFIVQVAMMP